MILLVIDIQKGITDERLYAYERFSENVQLLISEARKNDVEIVYVRHDDGKGSGFSIGDEAFEIDSRFTPVSGEKIFDKDVNSAFVHYIGLDDYLEKKGISKVIVTGLQTDYCIDATVKGGFALGFEMIVPAFCNTTRSNEYMEAETAYKFYNENMWPKRYAKCLSVEDTVELIRSHHKKEEKLQINDCGPETIETERLILRRFSMEDADSMMRNWVSDDDVQSMYGEPSYKTKEEVEALISEFIKRCQGGYSYRWSVIEKASGECIGQVAYFLVDSQGAFGEIEYCIGSAFQGKGYATEATKAVIDFGFRRIGFNKVQICVRPSNTSSKRVIEKCGFTYEGALRDYFRINGEFEDRLYYSILKEEWNDIVLCGK